MSFAQHRARLTDGVFATLGVDAVWSGLGDMVRVRFKEADKVDDYGRVDLIQRVRMVRVRSSEVPAPKKGDHFELIDACGCATGRRFRVSGEGMLDQNEVWRLPVVPLDHGS